MKPVSSDDRHDIFSKTPFMRHLGMRREFSRDGHARVTLDPAPELGNVIGAVHGGVVVTLLDVVMASAAVSMWMLISLQALVERFALLTRRLLFTRWVFQAMTYRQTMAALSIW